MSQVHEVYDDAGRGICDLEEEAITGECADHGRGAVHWLVEVTKAREQGQKRRAELQG